MNTISSAPNELDATLAELERQEAELKELIAAQRAEQEAKLTDVQRQFRKRRDREINRRQATTDSEYWFCVCFNSREQKEAFLKSLEWDEYGDKYINGVALAEAIDVPLPAADLRFVTEKTDKRLSEISLPLD